MPTKYVHLVNSDVDEAIFEHLGIKTKNEEKARIPLVCHICEMPNSPESTICSKCGKPLDLKTATEIDEMKDGKIKALEENMENVYVILNEIKKKIN